MIATTTSGDIIVIVTFATILVLVVTGILAAMKWLMRVMQRKPRPIPRQSVGVVFQMIKPWKQDEDEEGEFEEAESRIGYEIRKLSAYLEWRLQSDQIGEFDVGKVEGERVSLFFFGPDARQIWDKIEADVRTYSPVKPLEVRFDFGRRRGGKVIQDIASDAPHDPKPIPDFERWDPPLVISPIWRLLLKSGAWSALLGFLGLFLNSLGRKVAGISEKENMRSGFDAFVILGLSGMFVIGIILCLICVCVIQRMAKRPNTGPMGRALQGAVLPKWISSRLILIIVAGVITGVLLLLQMM